MSRLVIYSALILSLGSCVSRPITPPRSEVIADAEAKGLSVSSIDQDKEAFLKTETVQRERLMTLIRNRASSSFRDQNYRIGANDELEINVFDVPELNVTARVRQSGFVSLPLVGAVMAVGLTETEFHDVLKKRLSSYVKEPQVSVFIAHYGSQQVAVIGAVNKPGTYPLKKGSNSLLELISEAGGVSDHGASYLNFIPAEISGVSASSDVETRAQLALAADMTKSNQISGIEVYLDQIMGTSGGIPLEIPVRGGDMIVVPEAGKIMVEGEVANPGAFEISRRMTLLGALAAAGGITYGAKVDEVEVIREVGIENKTRMVVDLVRIANAEEKDLRLRNGDLVRVPSDGGKRVKQDTFESITKIINFGVGGTVNLVN